jgi:hypothetical protein
MDTLRGPTHIGAALSHEQDKTTGWRNLEDMVLSERSRHTRPHSVIPLIGKTSRIGESRDRKWFVGTREWGESGVTAHADRSHLG